MPHLVLLRHGESTWNLDNRFTGWTDVDLSAKGLQESVKAGKMLKANGLSFDMAFTSVLKRSIRTLWIVLEHMDLMWIPVRRSWHLNERHYGALQGLNKHETTMEYGERQVYLWRRSYSVRPPALELTDQRYPGKDPRYKECSQDELPLTESLEDTIKRCLPYLQQTVFKFLQAGKNVLIVAHGNSLRGIIKYLNKIPDTKISSLNIPTGIPLLYEVNDLGFPVDNYYLFTSNAVKIRRTSNKN